MQRRMEYAWLLMAVVVIGWSVGPVGAKALLRGRGPAGPPHPLQVALWAIAAGWVLLFLLLAARGRLAHLRDFSPRGWAVLLAMGFFGWAGYTVSLNYALARLPLPDAVIINYLHPVFTLLLQGAPFGLVVRRVSGWEQPPPEGVSRPPWPRLAAGIALCLLGVAFVATGGRPASPVSPGFAGGAAAALFAALFWGIYSNLGRFVALKPGLRPTGRADVQTFAAMSLGLAMLVAVLSAAGMLRGPAGQHTAVYFGNWGPASLGGWVVAAGMGLFLYCIGFTAWLAALEVGHAAGRAHQLPPITYLTPVLTILLGRLVLHDGFGPGFWPGALLILAGNLVVLLPSGRRR